ncbi:hypothetical protein [Flavobacterium sp. H122]|uniref:hypothetical protein n=1 Tax=Flavobacterium sp. H122 TaxID=2529860 RepID=UPI0010AAB06D|nr:hypothetical protein [Flavobacterium sp. H122]
MNFHTYKTNIGYCHINNELIAFSLDNTTDKVSDNFIYKEYGKSFIKIIFTFILFYSSIDGFKTDKVSTGIISSLLGLLFLIDILNFVRKKDYLFKKRILKNTIQKINGDKRNEIEITYLNEKNRITTISIKIPENQTKKEMVIESLLNKR